jgi:hypothetical protein
MKLEKLSKMSVKQLEALNYENAKYYELEKLKPTITTIRETPFTKNILQQNHQYTLDKSTVE